MQLMQNRSLDIMGVHRTCYQHWQNGQLILILKTKNILIAFGFISSNTHLVLFSEDNNTEACLRFY